MDRTTIFIPKSGTRLGVPILVFVFVFLFALVRGGTHAEEALLLVGGGCMTAVTTITRLLPHVGFRAETQPGCLPTMVES